MCIPVYPGAWNWYPRIGSTFYSYPVYNLPQVQTYRQDGYQDFTNYQDSTSPSAYFYNGISSNFPTSSYPSTGFYNDISTSFPVPSVSFSNDVSRYFPTSAPGFDRKLAFPTYYTKTVQPGQTYSPITTERILYGEKILMNILFCLNSFNNQHSL